MNHNQVEMVVLIKGRPITEYYHHGQTFVEGRAGSEYEIELKNNNHRRVEAVLSVDGLSVIDGKAAGAQSSGYLIEPNQSIRVPGWILDNNNVAKFAFSGKKESYATQMTGDARNNGVIGIMAFSEQYTPPVYLSAAPLSAAPFVGSVMGGGWGGIACSNSFSDSAKYMMSKAKTMSATLSNTRSASPSVSPYVVDQSDQMGAAASFNYVEQSLGTAFGESTQFATTTVQFKRGDMLALFVIHYDDLRGLKSRGIILERTRKGQYKSQPQAFPAEMGCKPPQNWRG